MSLLTHPYQCKKTSGTFIEMNPKSVRTLLWLSVILLVLGSLALSPELTIFLMILTALCALPSIIVGSDKKSRIGGVVIVTLSIILAAANYTDSRKQLSVYTKSHEQSR